MIPRMSWMTELQKKKGKKKRNVKQGKQRSSRFSSSSSIVCWHKSTTAAEAEATTAQRARRGPESLREAGEQQQDMRKTKCSFMRNILSWGSFNHNFPPAHGLSTFLSCELIFFNWVEIREVERGKYKKRRLVYSFSPTSLDGVARQQEIDCREDEVPVQQLVCIHRHFPPTLVLLLYKRMELNSILYFYK